MFEDCKTCMFWRVAQNEQCGEQPPIEIVK